MDPTEQTHSNVLDSPETSASLQTDSLFLGGTLGKVSYRSLSPSFKRFIRTAAFHCRRRRQETQFDANISN